VDRHEMQVVVSASIANGYAGALPEAQRPRTSAASRVKSYLFSDARRSILTVLGLIWLLDGALQFQSFMYSKGFLEMLRNNAAGQPQWLTSSINWSAHVAGQNLTAWNTLFALTQVLIGLGLLYRPTVKPTLVLSFAWAFVVWWFAEAFGMLFMMMATPFTGAPGAVLLYAIIGLAVWPTPRPGGLLGVRGVRAAWGALWVFMAYMWLQPQGSSAGSVTHAIKEAPSGMGWLSSAQHWAATAANGHGVAIGLVLAALSAAIGAAVALNWHPKPFLVTAIVLNVLYWVFGQGLGGIFTGSGTDPNSGPLFVLLACVMWWLIPYATRPVESQSEAPLAARRLELVHEQVTASRP
jgi:hypothetical protein